MRWTLPETAEQRVLRGAPSEFIVRVCPDGCGQEPAPSPGELQRYSEPNGWVDSHSREIQAFARLHAGTGSVQQRMERLTSATRLHRDGPVSFGAYQRASEAFWSRSGDCTEAAVLLAACARAAGIPARVVYGLVYSSRFTGVSHAFSPHAWVQAWTGTRWTSYDAGVGQFGSGHIALWLGDGSPTGTGRVVEVIRHLRIADASALSEE